MQQSNQAWISMFRRIPADLHEVLVLGLTTGAELVMQKLVRLEPEFMIIRGRVAGTQDSGRVIMLPYGQLTYVAVARLLKDPEVEAIFGKSTVISVGDLTMTPPADGAATPETPGEETAPESEPTAAPAEHGPAVKKPERVSKSILVAKLRERLKEAR
jgi:hypothetical protein